MQPEDETRASSSFRRRVRKCADEEVERALIVDRVKRSERER
jgi:hypothetical protein